MGIISESVAVNKRIIIIIIYNIMLLLLLYYYRQVGGIIPVYVALYNLDDDRRHRFAPVIFLSVSTPYDERDWCYCVLFRA